MSKAIETRPYGRADESVTVIGLGGSQLARDSFEQGVRTVHRALDCGIRYIDSSCLYPSSHSILGEALLTRNEDVFLATKIGHFSDPRFYRWPGALRACIRSNLAELQLPSVDTLQIHECDWACWWQDGVASGDLLDPTADLDYAGAPVVQVLNDARDQGLCRYIGATGNSATETAAAVRHLDVDSYLVAGHYNLLTRDYVDTALPVAVEKGVARIVAAVFGHGLMRPHPEWLESSPPWMTDAMAQRYRRVHAVHEESGLSFVELTIRFLIGDPHVTTILLGVGSPSEVEEDVAAALAGPLPPDLHNALRMA